MTLSAALHPAKVPFHSPQLCSACLLSHRLLELDRPEVVVLVAQLADDLALLVHLALERGGGDGENGRERAEMREGSTKGIRASHAKETLVKDRCQQDSIAQPRQSRHLRC